MKSGGTICRRSPSARIITSPRLTATVEYRGLPLSYREGSRSAGFLSIWQRLCPSPAEGDVLIDIQIKNRTNLVPEGRQAAVTEAGVFNPCFQVGTSFKNGL